MLTLQQQQLQLLPFYDRRRASKVVADIDGGFAVELCFTLQKG